MEDEGIFDPQRRALLEKATVTLGAVGVAGACWPFIDSMNPGADALANATTEVDLSQISVGQTLTVSWQGKPVFVMHRTSEQIAEMALTEGGKDPQPDKARVRQAQWLVVLAVCTHLGCVPNRAEKGWICPCHGSLYDDSGRVLQGPAPRNLDVPPYLFSSDNTLVIGQV